MANKSKIKKVLSKKTKSGATEDESWILEGIVAYLQSPTWTVPVLNFVEENCGTFVNSEENKLEYTEIQKNYKKMVERLLVCYMQELNLTEKQFSKVCSRENKDIPKMDRENFQYIWAADDFLLFKRLMLQKNLKVEMEALHMLKTQDLEAIGENHEFAVADKQFFMEMHENFMESNRTLQEYNEKEEEDIKLAIEFSKMEMERLQTLADKEKRMIEEAIKLSLESSSGTQSNSSPEKFEKSSIQYPNALPEPVVIESSHEKPPDFSSASLVAPPTYQKPSKSEIEKVSVKPESIRHQNLATKELPPVIVPKTKSNSQAATDWLNNAMKEITESPTHAVQKMSKSTSRDTIDPEELEKRRAYLKAQRDKLLMMKKKEREKELSDYNQQIQESQTSSEETKAVDPEEEKRLASRRAVAQRLKREVIHKN